MNNIECNERKLNETKTHNNKYKRSDQVKLSARIRRHSVRQFIEKRTIGNHYCSVYGRFPEHFSFLSIYRCFWKGVAFVSAH